MIKLKRMAVIAIALSLTFSATAFGAEMPPDVAGQSYEKAVQRLFDKGIITGDENGNFNPEQTLTRAQACIIVVKSMNPPVAQVAGTATQEVLKSGFRDITGYSWAEGYISYAVKKGVAKGYPDGTFKPGNKVSSDELVTMILRAAGHKDSSLEGTWPLNYKNMAETLNIYAGLQPREEMPEFSSKWMAAQMDYNALEMIENANKTEVTQIFGAVKALPSLEGAKLILTGSFDAGMSSFAGMPLSDNIQLYTYGNRKEYVMGMVLSENKSDYRTENIYKYKRVVAPAQYIKQDGKITSLIIPKDVGYTGNIYCVINAKTDSLLTLTAAREINWEYIPGLSMTAASQGYLDGTVFRLNAMDGKIQSLAPVADMKNGYSTVEDYKINGPVKISSGGEGEWIEISSSATIYTIDSRQSKYKAGSTADIKQGLQVRLFDISDDEEMKADIVVIKL